MPSFFFKKRFVIDIVPISRAWENIPISLVMRRIENKYTFDLLQTESKGDLLPLLGIGVTEFEP